MEPPPPSYDDAISGDYSSPPTSRDRRPSGLSPPTTGDQRRSNRIPLATGNQRTSNRIPPAAGDQGISNLIPSATGDQRTSNLITQDTGDQRTSGLPPSATGNQRISGLSLPPSSVIASPSSSLLPPASNNKPKKYLRLWFYFVGFLVVLAGVGIFYAVTRPQRSSIPGWGDCKHGPPYIPGGTWKDCLSNFRGEYFERTVCGFECDGFRVLSVLDAEFNGYKSRITYTCIGGEWVSSNGEINEKLECVEADLGQKYKVHGSLQKYRNRAKGVPQ